MSGIADILLESGYRVSGSDRQASVITEYLKKRGAEIFIGHSESNLREIDLLVYTSAVKADNPERKQARKMNIPQIRRAEMLAEVVRMKYTVAISGTHGKTTTTSLCAEVLTEAGLDPTVIVGGRLKSSMTNARVGSGEFAVVEADEYDRSFLALSPSIAVVTSLETDHLDIYKNLADMQDAFLKFCNQTPFYGLVIANADEENIRAILPEIRQEIITFGFNESADFRVINPNYESNRSRFEIVSKNENFGEFELSIPGEYNIKNALAAFVVGVQSGIQVSDIRNALKKFSGVERRFETKAVVNDIMIVDDYAHHPTEVRALLTAAKSGWHRRVVAVFQPHLFSRTRDFYREFAQALLLADEVVLAPIYPAREEALPGVDSTIILDELKQSGKKEVMYVSDLQALPQELSRRVRPGDMVITIGAGDIWMYGEKLAELLK